MTITVRRRTADYCGDESSTRWGCGRSAYEAIGDVIVHHGEFFGIRVELEGAVPAPQQQKLEMGDER